MDTEKDCHGEDLPLALPMPELVTVGSHAKQERQIDFVELKTS